MSIYDSRLLITGSSGYIGENLYFFLAILNEFVWRTQSEEFWVNFKVWGLIPLTFIFTIFQIQIINKYKIDE